MNFFAKIKDRLTKTSDKISEGLKNALVRKRLDNEILENLEDVLIAGDLGPRTAAKIIENLRAAKFDKDISEEEIKEFLASEIYNIIKPCEKKLNLDKISGRPRVISFVGVNGSGKTTTIGKIGNILAEQNGKIVLAACDTFRAAAFEQLEKWAERSGCEFFKGDERSDPASVAFKAYERSVEIGADFLLVDTAGRLQNKSGLMEELAKINRVLSKKSAEIPDDVIIVIDGSTGQNAIGQIEIFKEFANLSGIIITKLDGTAKGGVLVAIADKFQLPIYKIGIGENIEDLRDFDAKDFANAVIGV